MNSSREDYLTTIYRLSREMGFTTNKDISTYLNVNKTSVSEMLKKLEKENLIENHKNKITLSELGKEKAKNTLSKHRIWEYFLENYLKMPKEKIHYQADRLEHVTDSDLLNALNQYLGYPELSPNGHIIFENQEKKD